MAVSLPFALVSAVVVSATLMWLNGRGVGPVGAAAGTLAACVAVAAVQSFAFGPVSYTRQATYLWLLFVLLPGLIVCATSRLGVFQSLPWLLLFLGPLSFVFAVVVVVTMHNMLFASRNPG